MARFIEGYHERLEEACRESGLSKAEIARRCRMKRSCLYNDGMLSSFFLAKFCAVTKVSADWLLGLKREKEAK